MDKAILFIYLALFPFGQLLRVSIFNASDILAISALIYLVLVKKEGLRVLEPFKDLVIIALFSLLYSLFNFKSLSVFTGLLYFLRVVSYFYLYKLSFNIIKKNQKLIPVLFNSLILVSFVVASFGWVQYFFYPDLTSLKYIGWDDHLFRLVGTFLDPGFTSLIIVFGVILSFFKKKYFLTVFFLITLAYTYSRAGYISFLTAISLAGLLIKKIRLVILTIIFFGLTVLLLPKPAGEGVNLARTYSISSRISNYKETFEIFKKSPVLGIGFNNICLARKIYLNDTNLGSHSCSGSDSSLLLILATMGVVGLMVFVGSISKMLLNLKRGFYTNIFLVLLSAVFVHSIFVNSLFYPWIMGYLAISASLME
jgi:hypothetical protein